MRSASSSGLGWLGLHGRERAAGLRGRGELPCIGVAFVVLGLLGCPGDPTPDLEGGPSTGEPSSTTSGSTSTSEAGGTSDATSTSTGAADDASGTGVEFLVPADFPSTSTTCDPFTQSCPAGQKCNPFSEFPEATSSWSGWKCTPLAEDPLPPGEPCHSEGAPTSGTDDCERGAMCYGVDPDTLEGVCVSLCMGSFETDDYLCEDPSTRCHIETGGPVLVCLPVCDPIAQDCPAGDGCYYLSQTLWECAPHFGGAGAYGESCDYITECAPGLTCLDPSTVPPGLPCEGAAGCCTEICDLSDPLGDAQCAGAAEGQTCQAWYAEDTAPPGYENVGACALPQ